MVVERLHGAAVSSVQQMLHGKNAFGAIALELLRDVAKGLVPDDKSGFDLAARGVRRFLFNVK